MKSLTNWDRLKNIKDADIDLSEIPEITNSQLALARRKGRPIKEIKKQAISLRLPLAALNKLRASGRGWQTHLSSKIAQWVSKGLL
jgi:uncharacterized protein (DUF4415 family)